MHRWRQFEEAAPELASAGRAMIYQFGPGLGYIATVRPDGGPRMHPFCPIQYGDGLYGLIADSPKQRDLLRDGRYAFHTFPQAEGDDEFYLTGRVRAVDDAAEVEAVRAKMREDGASSTGDERCFELLIETAMFAKYTARGAWPPAYTIWHAEERP